MHYIAHVSLDLYYTDYTDPAQHLIAVGVLDDVYRDLSDLSDLCDPCQA